MYNFNTSLSTPPLLGVGVDICSNTPRTPEILNSLIAMTNPFEYSYSSYASQQQSSQVIPQHVSTALVTSSNNNAIFNNNNLIIDTSPVIRCKTEDPFLPNSYDNNSQSDCSSASSLESPSSTTPLYLASTISSTTPSLQQTRSQLIKAGVKLLIQNKRKNSGSSCDTDCKPPPLKIRATTSLSSPTSRNVSIPSTTYNNNNETVPSPTSSASSKKSPISVRSFPIKRNDSTTSCDEDSEPKRITGRHNITPEDEDRRRRRRERNKIAATKCRLKKRECINNLMRESETLESQNVDLKTQLKGLEEEYKYLTDMWQAHQQECKNMVMVNNTTNNNTTTNSNREQNNNSNSNNNVLNIMGNCLNELEAIKDTNNNKHLNQEPQLPSLTPLINCNVSFDFY